MLDQIAIMTWKNPIFMIIFFGALWYLPGILLRRRQEYLIQSKREKARVDKLEKLYPNKKQQDLKNFNFKDF